MNTPMSSPWGKVQYVKMIIPGILRVSTAGHGGVKLDRKHNAAMPEGVRTKGGWYEEDAAWALVAIRFPEAFPGAQEAAIKTAKTTYPDEYTILTGEKVELKDSWTLRKRDFMERTFDRFVVQSACRIYDGMLECHASRRSDGAQKIVRLSSAVYKSREVFGYVL